MPYKVLVVDDSTFFRRRVKDILNEDRELMVVGDARNGLEAIDKVMELTPDVITMDVEMPIMDGITAVKSIMKLRPTPILMFSSLTQEGAQATLDAMDAGALDFLPKRFEDIAKDRTEALDLLKQRVRAIARRRSLMPRPTAELRSSSIPESKPVAATRRPIAPVRAAGKQQYGVLAIGTSTGGPAALQKILTALPAKFPVPIVLVQHMPGTFTCAFAERLNRLCQIEVVEASGGETLRPGVAYLAPGGRQMAVEGNPRAARITVFDAPAEQRLAYKPSVDLTFSSLAKVYGADVLGVILTGMGADGREGCKLLKARGATIFSQDEASSVVYGMPQAVQMAGLSDGVYPIQDFAQQLLREMRIAS